MLLNQLLFYLLCAELVLCIILSLPYINHSVQPVIKILSAKFVGPTTTSIMNVSIGVIILIFLSNLQATFKHQTDDVMYHDHLRIRLLTSQRDMYISGFVLFLTLMLRLVYSSLENNLQLTRSLEAMKKQAQGAAAGYDNLHEEHEALKKQVEVFKQVSSEDGEVSMEKLVDLNATLTARAEKAEKDAKTAEAQLASVKKQAASQNDAYMKLVDTQVEADERQDQIKELQRQLDAAKTELKELTKERDSLKTQIQDYDFMFLDAKKKEE